jgi:hypothetical protein
MADDGNFLKVVAVAEEEIRIAPPLAAFLTGKVFQQHEKLDRSGTGDFCTNSDCTVSSSDFFSSPPTRRTRRRSACCSRLALMEVWFGVMKRTR